MQNICLDRSREIAVEILETYMSERATFDESCDGYVEQNRRERQKDSGEYSSKISGAVTADEIDIIAEELLGLYRGVCSSKIHNANGYEGQMKRECEDTIAEYRQRLSECFAAA